MPELPEVETVKRTLETLILNKTIESIDVYRDKTILDDVNVFKNSLTDETILRMSRVGKFLVFHFTNNKVMISHLRMEGKFFLKKKTDPVGKHDLVVFNFKDGSSLRYNDTRRFGIIGLRNEDNYKTTEPISKLGPEPFNVTKEWLVKSYKNKKIPMKSMLLDQSVMCGLGNIYADEVLFETKIHPLTLAQDINEEQIEQIIASSISILNKAITLGGSTIHSYQSAEGVNGEFQINLKAYGNEGKTCPNCNKEPLIKIFVGGRSSTFCPNCQRNISNPRIIGVTGPVGSGKSTVSELLSLDKYEIIDADKIVHELYKDKDFAKGLEKHLSIGTITSNRIIDRDLLRVSIINNPRKKSLLEKFVWESVDEEIKARLKKHSKEDIVILDVPMLYESGLNYICDKIVLVYADLKTQITHLKKRGANVSDLIKINADYHLEEKKKFADYLIDNNGSLASLKKKVNDVVNSL